MDRKLKCCGNCKLFEKGGCKKAKLVWEGKCAYDTDTYMEYPKGDKVYKCWE